MIGNNVVQSPVNAQIHWETEFLNFKIDWEKVYTLIYKIAYTSKIQYFHLRMVNKYDCVKLSFIQMVNQKYQFILFY